MNAPSAAVMIGTNETLKTIVHSKAQVKPSILSYLFCGAIAGGFSGLITAPLDVIKTRLQTQNCKLSFGYVKGANHNHLKYRDLIQTIRLILAEEGLRGFAKGMLPRMLHQAPTAAITWTVYEAMKKVLNAQSHSDF